MFHRRKTRIRNGGEDLPFADMDGTPLHSGDFVESYRYELGICRIVDTDDGYVYESLESGIRVNWARMIDAHTRYQKVKKLDKTSSNKS